MTDEQNISKEQLLKLLENKLDKDRAEQSKLIRDDFPKLGQHFCMLGSTMSGKSFLIKYLLADVYKNVFDQIFVFNPTCDKENYDIFDIPDENLIKDFNQEDLQVLFDDISKEFVRSEGKIHTLWIFDDVCDKIRKFKDFPTLMSTARHYSITILLAEQYVKYISPPLRNNCLCYFVFPNLTDENIDTISESVVGRKKLRNLISAVRDENDSTDNPHGLLFWNKSKFYNYYYVTTENEHIELLPIIAE